MQQFYYSISEVAAIIGEPVSCIRFWSNSFPKQIHPHRTAKGDRQFTAEDIEAFKKIHYLVKVKGLTLDGAEKQLSGDNTKVDKTVKALESLKAIRQQLVEVKQSL